MKSVVDDLIANLGEQIDNLERFERLLLDQQKMLVENEVDSLKGSLNTQNQLTSAARNIEHRRKMILDDYQRELGEDVENPTLNDICENVDFTYAKPLKEIRETLIGAMKNVNRLKQQNELLIKKSLEIVGGTMKIYYHDDDRGKPSYTAGGGSPDSTGSSRMALNKVV